MELLHEPLVLAGLKIAFVLGFVLNVIPLMIWLERKVCAYIQDRVGPNRAAVFGTIRAGGMVHSLSDVVKLITKEDIRPAKANRLFYVMAPFLVLVPALLTVAVIPWADDLQPPAGSGFPSGPIPIQIARLDVGILFIFAIAGLSVFGIMLAGWASNNKFSLLGSLRASSQLISYEIALTLSAVSMMLTFGTVRLEEMVSQQGGAWWGVIPQWGIFVQPLAFIIFLIAVFAEANRLPFDLPEGESEIVAGYHTEYSGFKFALFFMAEYAHMIIAAAIVATVFLGGWQVPFATTETLRANAGTAASVLILAHAGVFLIAAAALLRRYTVGPSRFKDRRDFEPLFWGLLAFAGAVGAVLVVALGVVGEVSGMAAQWVVALAQFMAFVAKMFLFLFLFVWVRWTLPRFRFDHVMRLGWKGLMPLAIANIIVTAAVVLYAGGVV